MNLVRIKNTALLLSRLMAFMLLPSILKNRGPEIALLMLFFNIFFLILLPYYLSQKKKKLTETLHFFIAFGLLIGSLGFGLDYFNDSVCFWWDEFCHFLQFFGLTFLVFYLFFQIHLFGRLKLSQSFKLLFIFGLMLSLGTIWEITEFSFDLFFQTGMQDSLADTMSDLMLDSFGVFMALTVKYLFSPEYRPKSVKDLIAEEVVLEN